MLSTPAAVRLSEGALPEGLALCRQAVQKEPQSTQYALYLGIALKRANDLPEAERQWKRAIELDPSLEQSYIELGILYASQGRMSEVAAMIGQYLKWNPQSISFRLQAGDH